MFRAALMIVSALAAGAAVGRRRLSEEIDRRLGRAIDDAAKEARARIKSHARDYVARTMRRFAMVTAVKVALLSSAWAALQVEWIGPAAFAWTVSSFLIVFILRDAVVLWPLVRQVAPELRRHGWKPKTALSELVAAQVFEDVVEEAAEAQDGRYRKILFALAGRDRTETSEHVARAVADIARRSTWDDLKPFIFMGAARFATLSVLYSIFVFLLVTTS